MPRKYILVLHKKWEAILSEHYSSIQKETSHQDISIGVELYHFITNRADENQLFFFCNALYADLKPHKSIFICSFISQKKLILIYVLPPFISNLDYNKILNDSFLELQEAKNLFKNSPQKIGINGAQKIFEFKSTQNNDESLEPCIIAVIPSFPSNFNSLIINKNIVDYLIPLDQILAIIDEIKDLDELSEFFDYLNNNKDNFKTSLSSYVDHFASFRDLSSVLIPGARMPNAILLDPHWGTSYRYNSLLNFWNKFPEIFYLGHPRSLFILEQDNKNESLILRSKCDKNYCYYINIDKTCFFILAPVELMSFDQLKVVDMLMNCLKDSFILYKAKITELNHTKTEKALSTLFYPISLVNNDTRLAHLTKLKPKNSLFNLDITLTHPKQYSVRIVFDDTKLTEELTKATDRSFQIEFFVEVLNKINSVFKDTNFENLKEFLLNEKEKPCRFYFFSTNKEVSFPEFENYQLPEKKERKIAEREVAHIAKANQIQEGSYENNDAKLKIDSIKSNLIKHLDNLILDYNYRSSITTLISNIDALSEENYRKNIQIKSSIEKEVDYEREVLLGNEKNYFAYRHRFYRYLLEKFIQLEPKGSKVLSEEDLRLLLAFADKILSLYQISDSLHYGIYPAKIKIDNDYLVEIIPKCNINEMLEIWDKENAQIELGSKGNKEDHLSVDLDYEKFLNDLDENFNSDLGFSLRDMICLQETLATRFNYESNKTYCEASFEEINEVCTKNIANFDSNKTKIILDFLLLRSDKILLIEGSTDPALDLPVWEHYKRQSRYNLRCIIKIEDKFYWGTHSIKRSSHIWMSSVSSYKLPANFDTKNTNNFLQNAHKLLEEGLQNKAKEIASRYTSLVNLDVYPHELKLCSEDIGDSDVIAFIPESNVILNIESKIIDSAYCDKDTKRLHDKIFGRTSSDGSYKIGYLSRHETRHKFLLNKGTDVAKILWKIEINNPKIISLFVTQTSHWWTRFPTVKSEVNFLEIALLDDFIKSLKEIN